MSSASLQLGGDNWAAKDGNLLGYQRSASSSVHVPHEFTFSRGSNLAATRVAANGLIEKGRENLLLQSNQFDTTWSAANASVTSGQSGYDGSNNAWLLGLDYTGGQGSYLRQEKSISGVNTFSIYAKKGSNDGVYVEFATGSYPNIKVNLSDGSLISTNGTIDTKIESVGNGWYRVSMSINQSLARVNIRSVNGSGINTTGNIYIQDAQLEQGMVATSYIESGSTTAKAGLLEDEPRIDYTGGTGSLLLEPSRTQLVTSEYFEDWDKNSGTTLTTNKLISPDGSKNATLVSCPESGGRVGYDVALTSGTTYTFSVYLKNNGGNTSIDIGSHGTAQLETITIDNDWNRYSTTFTATSTTTSNIRFVSSGSNINMYAFGAQMEQGSYPTSYIPNHSGGSVTRGADYSESSTSLSIGDSEFCAYYEIDAEEIPREGSSTFFRLEFGSSSDFIGIKGSSNSINNMYTLQTLGGYSETMGNVTEAGVVKFLINYSSGTGDLFVNGTKYDGVISGPTTGNTINNIELRGSGYAHDSKKILVFPEALSDAECITLTTL